MPARRLNQPTFVVMLVIGSCVLPHLLMAQENTDNKTDRQSPEIMLFAHLDKDGDGILTADEVPPERFRFFEHLLRVAGKEKNGELTKSEFLEALKPDELKVVAPQNLGIGGGGNRPDPNQIFQRFDRNKDGKLSRDEIPEQAPPRFKQIFDRLQKQELTREEFAQAFRAGAGGGRPQGTSAEMMPLGAGRGGFAAVMMRKLDANGDGKLSKEELQKVGDIFDDLDRDHDGFLEPAELIGPTGEPGRPPAGARIDGETAAVAPRDGKESAAGADSGASKPAGAGGAGQVGAGQGAARRKAGRPGSQKAQGPIQRFDTNGDGKISRGEAQGKLKENFDKIDLNGDGFLERDELRKALAAIGSK